MEGLNYDNILEFLNQFPDEIDKNIYEENLRAELPQKEWTLLGTLSDDRIGGGGALYRPWTHYAIGFYPLNLCDIYKDENNRILFSYIEIGGHFPFRRSFIATKKSPFIFEPVSFDITISQENHSAFLKDLEELGLNTIKIENDLKKFKEVYQITDELDPDEALITRKYFNAANNDYYYTLITKREYAVEIKRNYSKESSS